MFSFKEQPVLSSILIEKTAGKTCWQSITVDCSLHEDICRVIQETGRITAQYESGSFERLLWEHQERAVMTALQSMKWHPVLIRWCLYLRHLSSSAYNLMRESGVHLPSQRTLRDYTYYTTATFGFSGIILLH